MKQTNYLLFDFLDFDPKLTGREVLWKACRPTAATEDQGDVRLQIPFARQLVSPDQKPDPEAPRQDYTLRLRAYGNNMLRLSIGFGESVADSSPMLELAPDLDCPPLRIEKKENEWLVKDNRGMIRAEFNLKGPEINHWSDLLPPPDETLQAVFYPDGKNPVKISAYDQFFPARNEAIALGFVEENGKPHRSTLSLAAKPGERFTGTGERFAKMDLSGRTFFLKNQDGQGVNNRRTYKNIPFYLSSENYGMFLHTSSPAAFSLADHSTRSAQILTEEPALDVFLIGGDSPADILYEYRRLTGFPALPPLWSYGIWMSRMTYFSAEEVNQICDRLRNEGFPCDVIHLDTGWFRKDWLCEWKFNEERFPQPEKFIARLKEKGFRVSLWQLPYVAEEAEQYEEAAANQYIAPVAEKSKQESNFSSLDYAGSIDFTYPAAVEWYKSLLKELLDMGVVCIKTDFGEDIHMDADYHAMPAKRLNNLYALLYQKAAYEITKASTGEGIIWARAGWAGCQRYPLHWGGDAAASWDGMAGSLKGGLHLGLSGFGFWSHDVPGFHGVPDFMNSIIPDDLYMRWTQFGVFTSHIRYHGTAAREPYHFPEIADTVKRWWRLRYALIPYIYSQSQKTVQSGYPALRALLFHHPEDKICWHIDDQYYFGDDFMVAPVMNEQGIRDVYLPEGEWVNFFNGKIETGGKWLKNLETKLEEMPVWIKRNASLPLYPDRVDHVDEMDLSKAITIHIGDSFKGIWNHLNEE